MKPSSLDTILVPLDGSTLAECAVPIALGLLPAEGARLILMRVPVYAETRAPVGAEYNMLWPESRSESSTARQVYEDTRTYLDHIAARYKRDGLSVEARVEDGDRAGAIIDLAVTTRADLIVMTTHGRSGLSKWIIGSITERVLQDAPCPVMAVRANANCRPTQPVQGFPKRILVPLDGSELAEPALAPAMAIAQRLGSDLLLFRVAKANNEGADDDNDADSAAPAPDDYLDHVAAGCLKEGITATTVTIAPTGSGAAGVAAAILDHAIGEGIELIAMSTHGRSGLRRWVYGSVTEKVLHNADIAVLIVRPLGG